MTDDRELIDRLRTSLDEGARAVRSTPPPFTIVGSKESPADAAEESGPWRWLAVAATVVSIAAAGIVALAVTAGEDVGDDAGSVPPEADLLSTATPNLAGLDPTIAVAPSGLSVDPGPEFGTVPGEPTTGGVVTVSNGCVVLQAAYWTHVPVWPAGTSWDATAQAVALPDGTRIALGSQIGATGSLTSSRTPEEASPSTNIPARAGDVLVAEVEGLDACLAATGIDDIVYALNDIRVTVQAGTADLTAEPYVLTAIVPVMESPGQDPMACWQDIILLHEEFGPTDAPPTCPGTPIAGWDWSLVESESTAGSRWGVYVIAGTFDSVGTTFTITEPARPPSSADYDRLSIERNQDFGTPCNPPPGGWDPPWVTTIVSGVPVTTIPHMIPEIDLEQLRAIPGFSGVVADTESGVYTIRIHADATAREAAKVAIAEFYPGPVCIVAASHTEAELAQIHAELLGRQRAMPIGIGIGAEGVSVRLKARAPEFEAEFRAKYGEAIVFETMFPDPDWTPSGGSRQR